MVRGASSGCPACSAVYVCWCPDPLYVLYVAAVAERVTHELLPIPPIPLACCGIDVVLCSVYVSHEALTHSKLQLSRHLTEFS